MIYNNFNNKSTVHGSPVYQGTIAQTDCVYYFPFLGLLMRKRRRSGRGGGEEERISLLYKQQMEQQKSIALKH